MIAWIAVTQVLPIQMSKNSQDSAKQIYLGQVPSFWGKTPSNWFVVKLLGCFNNKFSRNVAFQWAPNLPLSKGGELIDT